MFFGDLNVDLDVDKFYETFPEGNSNVILCKNLFDVKCVFNMVELKAYGAMSRYSPYEWWSDRYQDCDGIYIFFHYSPDNNGDNSDFYWDDIKEFTEEHDGVIFDEYEDGYKVYSLDDFVEKPCEIEDLFSRLKEEGFESIEMLITKGGV